MPFEYGTCSHHHISAIYAHGKKIGLKTLKAIHRGFAKWWKKENPKPSRAMREMHELSLGMVEAVFPTYLKRCAMRDDPYNDFKAKKWVKLETVFLNTHDIGNGFCIPMTGRFDGIFVAKYRGKDYLWLLESKNPSRVDEDAIIDTLDTNVQVMFYLYNMMLMRDKGELPNLPIGGVVYNVLRRPGLRQHQEESLKAFLQRIKKDVEDRIDWYFMRFKMRITEKKIQAWADGWLTNVLDDMHHWNQSLENFGGPENSPMHYMNPESLITKYGRCHMYDIIVRGDTAQMHIRKHVFPELVD